MADTREHKLKGKALHKGQPYFTKVSGKFVLAKLTDWQKSDRMYLSPPDNFSYLFQFLRDMPFTGTGQP
jgi:hypothetical protein